MSDVIEIKGQYYIRANASIADVENRVLKHGDTFAIFDRHGDIRPLGFENQGLFYEGTRFLSRWKLALNDASPLLLSSNVKEDNDFLVVDMTNPVLRLNGHAPLPHGAIHLVRTAFVWENAYFERIEVSSFARESIRLAIELTFDADFIDLFEVRGTPRKNRGHALDPTVAAEQVVLAYQGLDSVLRQTAIHFNIPAKEVSAKRALFELDLKGQARKAIECRVSCLVGELPDTEHPPPGLRMHGATDGEAKTKEPSNSKADSAEDKGQTTEQGHSTPDTRHSQDGGRRTEDKEWHSAPRTAHSALDALSSNGDTFNAAFGKVHGAFRDYRRDITSIESSNPQFNDWLHQSRADLHLLLTRTTVGPYPYAGIPWFSAIFGRDGIVTALQMLWLSPDIARGVLEYLAQTQAREKSDASDAEPGKILHEQRKGEMAALKEVPFGEYYGSIDSTPLWLILAGSYYERTGEKEFVAHLWPNIERALAWIDHYGDCDGDGFVEYRQRGAGGLSNQGWKDSEDAIFHSDGSMPHPPIALCEVQGYVYEAKWKAALLAEALGHHELAGELREAARRLKERFHQAFWCEDIQTYALALDGDKKQCRVRASNAGHCLFSGIAQPEAAARIKAGLMSEASFSGWGIRTLATSEALYNPLSYHNGSVWPHDNSMIAAGFVRYGFRQAALRVANAIFDASKCMDSYRLPELFCGFPRRRGEGPTLYPVACNPQAWASAACFYLVQSCLGVRFELAAARLYFDNPHLPGPIERLQIRNLRLPTGVIDLTFVRHAKDVAVNVGHRSGKVEVVVIH